MSDENAKRAKAEIFSGICGFTTVVEAVSEGLDRVTLTISSECAHVERMAERLVQVDPFQEITFRGSGPLTLLVAADCLRHPACPVPAGVIKTVEVAAGLALPAQATITLEKGG